MSHQALWRMAGSPIHLGERLPGWLGNAMQFALHGLLLVDGLYEPLIGLVNDLEQELGIGILPVRTRRSRHERDRAREVRQRELGTPAASRHGAHTNPSMPCQDVLALCNQWCPCGAIAEFGCVRNAAVVTGNAHLLIDLLTRTARLQKGRLGICTLRDEDRQRKKSNQKLNRHVTAIERKTRAGQ